MNTNISKQIKLEILQTFTNTIQEGEESVSIDKDLMEEIGAIVDYTLNRYAQIISEQLELSMEAIQEPEKKMTHIDGMKIFK